MEQKQHIIRNSTTATAPHKHNRTTTTTFRHFLTHNNTSCPVSGRHHPGMRGPSSTSPCTVLKIARHRVSNCFEKFPTQSVHLFWKIPDTKCSTKNITQSVHLFWKISDTKCSSVLENPRHKVFNYLKNPRHRVFNYSEKIPTQRVQLFENFPTQSVQLLWQNPDTECSTI